MTVIDSFDTHARIPEHFADVDKAAKESGHLGIISVGWDPGLFSLARVYSNAILPDGKDYTFWGKGVSQGHSDAIRRIKGVKDAKQYTVPVESALEAVRSGSNPELTTREKHTRECFVVLEPGAHGGFVIRAAETSAGTRQVVEYSLRLESNPELTAAVLVASARAVARLQARGETGAVTLLDVPPALLSPRSAADLRRDLL